jgi:hypothetical protein
MEFSRKNVSLMLELDRKPMTITDQKIYSPFSFYLNTGFLKRSGIIIENGISSDNRKSWCLTDKGKKIVSHIKSINKLLKEAS